MENMWQVQNDKKSFWVFHCLVLIQIKFISYRNKIMFIIHFLLISTLFLKKCSHSSPIVNPYKTWWFDNVE